MKYSCDLCGAMCNYDFVPDPGQGFFAVCHKCASVLDPGVWTEKAGATEAAPRPGSKPQGE